MCYHYLKDKKIRIGRSFSIYPFSRLARCRRRRFFSCTPCTVIPAGLKKISLMSHTLEKFLELLAGHLASFSPMAKFNLILSNNHQ
jgi:hypothetical protein